MAKLSNEDELADMYEVLMAYAKGESVSEARFSDRHVTYRHMDHSQLVRMYKKVWALCNLETQGKYDVNMFNGPTRGAAQRRIYVY